MVASVATDDMRTAATYSTPVRTSDWPGATVEQIKRARIEHSLGRTLTDADWSWGYDPSADYDAEIAREEQENREAAGAALAHLDAMSAYTPADLEWADRCGFTVACQTPHGAEMERAAKLIEAGRQCPSLTTEQVVSLTSEQLDMLIEAKADSEADQSEAADDTPRPLYGDVAALLDGTMPEPKAPTLLTRDDGHAILYRGELNVLEGDPEDGKTFVALAAMVEEINSGGKALFVDMDHNGLHATVDRLVRLGANIDNLRSTDHFRYIEPDNAEDVAQVVADCVGWKPGIAVYDCVGELMGLHGGNNDSADDYTAIINRAVMPLVKAGAAAVLIDHLAKGKDSRDYGSGGTMAKRRKLGGVAVRVQPIDKLTRGRGGRLRLIGRKDRHSGIRSHCPAMPKGSGFDIGEFVITEDAETGRMQSVVYAPGDGALMQLADGACGPVRDSDREYLQAAEELTEAKPDGFTVPELAKTVDNVIEVSTAQREDARRVVNRLVTSGYLQCVHAGSRGVSNPSRYVATAGD